MRYAILAACLTFTLASATSAGAATTTPITTPTAHAVQTVDYDYYGRWYCGPHCQWHAQRQAYYPPPPRYYGYGYRPYWRGY